MATPEQISKHNDIIQQVLDSFDDLLDGASKVLENKIAQRILATTTVDELLGLRVPIDADFRELIMTSIREYLPELDAIARDTISYTPQDATQLDNRVASELKANMYTRLQETVTTTRETVNTEIVVGALGGYALATIAQNARHAISGLMITSSDVEITRLQNRLRKLRSAQTRNEDEISSVFRQLKGRFAGVSVGSAMTDKVSGEMHDLVMDFDGVFTLHRGRQAGLQKFKYTGTLVANSRDFCVRNVGKVFTESEAKALWASESWSGKRSGDPFIVRGGHRCRHFWVPVED
jgi:hypothetical protein